MNIQYVAGLVERIGTLVRAELRREAVAHGLTTAQLEVLFCLASVNRYSDSVLSVAEYLGATKGTTSQTINALESKGLVAKRADAEDKRRVHCQLTRAGKRVLARAHPPPMLAGALEDMGRDPSESLLELLRALQQRNEGRVFGVCHTCKHFERGSRSHHCGLTGERLSTADSRLLCREHLPVV